MNRVRVAVAVGEKDRDRIDEIARACGSIGFELDTTLRTIGVLTGSVESEDLPKLRQVPGVTAVEPEREFRLPPPTRPRT
jgi:hypothetical protein